MKKFASAFILSSLMLSGYAQAQNNDVLFAFGIYHSDTSQLISENQVNRSDNSQVVCWAVFSENTSLNPTLEIKENFATPVGAHFNSAESFVRSSLDGSRHTVTTIAESLENSIIERCWNFDYRDPLGKYTLTVQLDGQPVGAATFEVLP